MADLERTDAYAYELPSEQIATEPAAKRSASRLLRVEREGVVDGSFADLPELLRPEDLLVVNDARVSPVRVRAARATGGAVEVFVLGLGAEGRWDDADGDVVAMTRSNKRLKDGEVLDVAGGGQFVVIEAPKGGHARLRTRGVDTWSLLDSRGEMPLPPYITKRRRELGREEETEADRQRYQTVFAREPGAVAAPTAGLHFDDHVLERLDVRGVQRAALTLWVGVGTFAPVRTDNLDEHRLHREYFTIPTETAGAIRQTRERGGRVVAVGTTVVRALEASVDATGAVRPGPSSTDLFVRPGYAFGVVDALVTNFHLPESTLLALVCAFGGYERVMAAYAHAVCAGYRFYSYGDAMFLPQRDAAPRGEAR